MVSESNGSGIRCTKSVPKESNNQSFAPIKSEHVLSTHQLFGDRVANECHTEERGLILNTF